MAAESQPMVLITMRKLLNNAYKNTLRTDISSSTIPPVKYLGINIILLSLYHYIVILLLCIYGLYLYNIYFLIYFLK